MTCTASSHIGLQFNELGGLERDLVLVLCATGEFTVHGRGGARDELLNIGERE